LLEGQLSLPAKQAISSAGFLFVLQTLTGLDEEDLIFESSEHLTLASAAARDQHSS